MSGTPAPKPACGCASQPVEQPAFNHGFVFEREATADRGVAFGYDVSFDPVSDGPTPGELPISLLLFAWLAVAAVFSLMRRRPDILTLGLVGPSVSRPAKRWPRLVLSSRERRFLRTVGSALGRLASFSDPRPVAVLAAGYNQPRLRNHKSMPPPIAMQTPQKIGYEIAY